MRGSLPSAMRPIGAMLCALMLFGWVGCTFFTTTPTASNKSPLRPFEPNEQQAALEITTLHLPKQPPEERERLWSGIDELALDPELRRQLALNGFRVGIIRGEMPSVLDEMITAQLTGSELSHINPLKLPAASDDPTSEAAQQRNADTSKPVTPSDLRVETPIAPPAQNGAEQKTPDDDEPETFGVVKPKRLAAREPGVRTHTIYLQTDQPVELQSGGLHDQWPLLWNQAGQLQGKTLTQAQGVWQVRARQRNNGLLLKLTPEIQHGDPKSQWVGEDGVIRQEIRKPKQQFAALTIEVQLQPGQALVLVPQPDRPGSMGQYFLGHRAGEELQPRLLLVRVARAGTDELLK
jgi:hypothetical protein